MYLLLLPVILLALVVFNYLSRHKDFFIERRCRQLIEQERRAYVKDHYRRIHLTLCHKEWIILSDEDDEMERIHEKRCREYERLGMTYHWYPEMSREMVFLPEHPISFSLSLVREITLDFCVKRCLLLESCQVCRETQSLEHILSLLYRLLLPKVGHFCSLTQ